MNDETLVRMLSESVAYQAAFKTSVLVLKDIVALVEASPKSHATAARCREVLSLVRGEFLTLPAGFRDDREDGTNRCLRAKLAELLRQIEPLLAAIDDGKGGYIYLSSQTQSLTGARSQPSQGRCLCVWVAHPCMSDGLTLVIPKYRGYVIVMWTVPSDPCPKGEDKCGR